MNNGKTFAVFCLLIALASCKKGEDDPAVSLLSRKSRLAGEWTLQEASITIDALNTTAGTHFDGVYTLVGSRLVGTESTLTTINSVSGTYILSMKIEKDGSFSVKETMNTDALVSEGRWNFSSGVGEEKKKESVQFIIESSSSGNTGLHFFNQFSTKFIYKIKELRKKTLVLTITGPTYINKKGITENFNAEYTFSQD